MTNALFDALFAQHLDNSKPFLHTAKGESFSYQAFLHRVAQMAHALDSFHLAPDDRVAVQIEKSVDALALYAACLQTGTVYLPLNTAYTANEVAYFLENSQARLLVCDDQSTDHLTPLAQTTNAQLTQLNPDGTGHLAEMAGRMSTSHPTVPRKADDLAALLYTSGTTGRPKGAMLTHQNLLANAQALVSHWQFTADDVLLHALPLFHSHGLFVATHVTLLARGAMILLPKFDVELVIHHLPDATTMMGVPTFYTRLLADPRLNRELVAHVRLLISGSAPLLATTHTEFENRTGHQILERYGMTETNMNTSNPYHGARRPGYVGTPLDGVEVRISDATTGVAVPTGDVGQVEIRGANVFMGYWGMPYETAAAFRAGGFFRTGDLGRMDADGYLQLIGRQSDLIISGGYNVYPKEVEQVLDAQPGVRESAVIGVPHVDLGEGVVAVLAVDEHRNVDLAQIRTALNDSLARFKHPKQWIIIPELPRNAMGKVQKQLLRDQLATTFTDA